MAQLDLFPDMKIRRTKASKEYGAFTDKFKTKLTTDDCYTPKPVYNAVRDWCVEHYGLQGREIVRPFWPGAARRTIVQELDENAKAILKRLNKNT